MKEFINHFYLQGNEADLLKNMDLPADKRTELDRLHGFFYIMYP
jgi:hypothetical protein